MKLPLTEDPSDVRHRVAECSPSLPTNFSSMINRDGNRIEVTGKFGDDVVRKLLATLQETVEERGYEDMVLDFSKCTAAYGSSMLPICAHVSGLRLDGVDTAVILPTTDPLARLFRNTNWAYYLDPRVFDRSTYRGSKHVPALNYSSDAEQFSAVNSLVEAILGAVDGIARSEFQAIEWALNEITDNVLVHSQSRVGGFVQLTTFQKDRLRVEFVVCDSGIGVPGSLRAGGVQLRSDAEALDKAIREGVTRDPSVGQGNGLFGTFQVCRVSGGNFAVHSGLARLYWNADRGLHIRAEQIPIAGTVVQACIDCSKPGVLEKALRFKGRAHVPLDFLEAHLEQAGSDRIVVTLRDAASSFGSRLAGTPVRTKLKNIGQMYEGQKVYIDFDGIPVISSSFADEVFGKLFVELGPLTFMQRFQFLNITETVRSLIDRAIQQRARAAV